MITLQRELELARLSADDLRVGLRKPGLNAETRDFMQRRLCYLTADARKLVRVKFNDYYVDWIVNGGLKRELGVRV